MFQEKIDTEVVSSVFEQFVSDLKPKKRTYIVLDNAPTHKSKRFLVKVKEWESSGKIKFFFLPAYSPELNLIEILWKNIKLRWLPFEAFKSFGDLFHNLHHVLKSFGQYFTISFG